MSTTLNVDYGNGAKPKVKRPFETKTNLSGHVVKKTPRPAFAPRKQKGKPVRLK